MASIIEEITQNLGGDTLGQISQMLGAGKEQTNQAVGAGLSTILGALQRNSTSEQGAQALHQALGKDHDGSVLGNLAGLLSNPEGGAGAGILRHVLGGKQKAVETGIGQTTGLKPQSVSRLLTMLAPVVMGTLGQRVNKQGLDISSLGSLLGQERKTIESKVPQAQGLLSSLLDSDGDGDVDVKDFAQKGLGMLGNFLKR